MTDMPFNIWAYKSTKGRRLSDGAKVDVGYQGTGTWIDFDDSCEGDEGTQYINKAQLVERLRGMRSDEVQHLGNFPMIATYNAAIDAVIKMLNEPNN